MAATYTLTCQYGGCASTVTGTDRSDALYEARLTGWDAGKIHCPDCWRDDQEASYWGLNGDPIHGTPNYQ